MTRLLEGDEYVCTARMLSVIVVDGRYGNRCFGKMRKMV